MPDARTLLREAHQFVEACASPGWGLNEWRLDLLYRIDAYLGADEGEDILTPLGKAWEEWFEHMDHPRRVTQPMFSAADQQAFFEIVGRAIRAAREEKP